MNNMEINDSTNNGYRKSTTITLKDLPKLSLNQWYGGTHWTKRKKLKDQYILLTKSQFKGVFPKNNQYVVHYAYFFKTRPLDASNAIAMTKMIEDIIFEDDKWDIIREISISSQKAKQDYVTITVNEYEN